MLKKRGLLVAAVLGLLVLGTGVAYAAGEQPPDGLRAGGKITDIDLGASSFTIETLRNGELTVIVSDSTQFHSREGDIQGLEDLEVGMPVHVAGKPGSTGEVLADVVAVGKPGERQDRFRFRGEITDVAASDGSFTLKTLEGEKVEIHVSDRTRFRGRDDSIQGIEDLEVGMLSQVQGLKGPEGKLNALLVGAGAPGDRPDVRAIGEISTIGDRSFTLENRQGRSLTFKVDESTKYRSRDGAATSFEDLEVGMKAVVTGDEIGEGSYKAIMVGVGVPQAAPERRPQTPLQTGPGV
jgi:hypothetical protein